VAVKVRCAPCHVTAMPRAGMPALDLADAQTAFTSLTTVNTDCAMPAIKARVVPNNPDMSYLIKKLAGGPEICGMRMPRGCVEAAPDGGASDARPDAITVDATVPDAALPDAAIATDATSGDGGADAAPPPRACLPAAEVNMIRAWIMSGAK
jgi:hypothetical protein